MAKSKKPTARPKRKQMARRRSPTAALENRVNAIGLEVERSNEALANELAGLKVAIDDLKRMLDSFQANCSASFRTLTSECVAAREAAAGAENLIRTSWERRQTGSSAERTSGTLASSTGRISDQGHTPINSDSATNAGFPRRNKR